MVGEMNMVAEMNMGAQPKPVSPAAGWFYLIQGGSSTIEAAEEPYKCSSCE